MRSSTSCASRCSPARSCEDRRGVRRHCRRRSPIRQRSARILDGAGDRVELTVRSASDRDDERDTRAASTASPTRTAIATAPAAWSRSCSTLWSSRRSAANARAPRARRSFLEAQIREYEQRLRDAEDRLAEFKKQQRRPDARPSRAATSRSCRPRSTPPRRRRPTLSIAVSRRAELPRQLRGEARGLRLRVGRRARARAASTARQRYACRASRRPRRGSTTCCCASPTNIPTSSRRAQTLEEFKRRRAAEIESLRRGDAECGGASGAGSNPVYQSIQLALNQADVEIASLRGADRPAPPRRGAAPALDTAPQVEAEFAQLNRDYDVNKTQYTALLANYEKARLGEQADNAGSVRFEIVQPPTASFSAGVPAAAACSWPQCWLAALRSGRRLRLPAAHAAAGGRHRRAAWRSSPDCRCSAW